MMTEHQWGIRVSRHRKRRCPFLALLEQQAAARRSKRRHKAKVQNRSILPIETRDLTNRRNWTQTLANVSFSGYEPDALRDRLRHALAAEKARGRINATIYDGTLGSDTDHDDSGGELVKLWPGASR